MTNNLHLFSISGFLLVCILFFLPFVSIQCGENTIAAVSGIELATGFEFRAPSESSSEPTTKYSGLYEFALLALLAGFAGAVTSIVLRSYPSRNRIAAISCSGAAVLCLLALQIQLNSEVSSEMGVAVLRLTFEPAYWLSLLLSLSLFIAVLVTMLRQSTNARTGP